MSRKTVIVLAASTLGVLIGATFLITLMRRYPTYVQNTHDMSPTILNGATIVVRRIAGAETLSHGDLVVYEAKEVPGQSYVKRVAGLPGETVEIRAGILYRNGEAVDEPWATHELLDGFPEKLRRLEPQRDNVESLVIPEDSLFLLGDDRSISGDSRLYGPVPRSSVRGKVVSIDNP